MYWQHRHMNQHFIRSNKVVPLVMSADQQQHQPEQQSKQHDGEDGQQEERISCCSPSQESKDLLHQIFHVQVEAPHEIKRYSRVSMRMGSKCFFYFCQQFRNQILKSHHPHMQYFKYCICVVGKFRIANWTA
jgi:hypothetical protein